MDAASVMTRDVLSVGPDDTVAEAARKLAGRGVSAAPVLDAEGRLLGIVSEGDLMRPFGREKQMHRAWWLNVIAEGLEFAPDFLEYIRLDQRRVRELMQPSVVTVTEEASLPAIADLLDRHHLKRVPVLRDGRVIGIVSRADIVRAVATAPAEIVEPV
ncbi:CBS domain-containing protein [Rhodovastum atsumiense]|uniref:CBS domain-containing protein n=1 Tax=Rhodovastum atsumiense TaxID=504468 RepID=A0A5M6IRT8_9PROT|nr:CBS domain-containing protein [Rhodovastum atsumiense]KAA5610629.1 CBS domain-containing protein [Rhodovastum atsumiense]CAH2600750.1 CBS domain-containing protein [Rhodovastum atsumiense]